MHKSSRVLIVLASLALLAGGAFAQSLSPSPNPAAGQVLPPGGPGAGPACGPITITESTTQNIVALNSVSCNAGGLHTDNSYYRAFDLSTFGITTDFNVCDVQFAIETATGAGGTQPATVNLYAGPVGFPTGFPASYTLIGTAALSIPDQALTIFSSLAAGTVVAGQELVVEVFTPNGQAAGNSFFIGSNPDGESAPSYLAAAACGITSPTDTAAIGFPNMDIVMNVIGDVPAIAPPIPTLGQWGLLALVLLLAGAATFVLRRH